MQRRIIIANWKMNPLTVKEAEKLFQATAAALSGIKKTEVVVCAPFIYLDRLIKMRASKVKLGAQDAFWNTTGPHTGEVSGAMLYHLGARYAIVGHSDKRALGES